MSNKKLDAWFGLKGTPKVIIATGFIAKNPAGQVREAAEQWNSRSRAGGACP